MPFSPYFIDATRLQALTARYRDFQSPTLGYATVRDFCDSVDHLPELATINRDLKDTQRPWALKSILSRAPVGSRLLEIGAGDPHVAHWLSLLGYDVWIVDPYEGYATGPTDFEFYRDQFPRIHFHRSLFSEKLDGFEPHAFDVVYSISVMEHVPHTALGDVIAGIRRFTKPGGLAIHAVDHVLQGSGQAFHEGTLRTLGIGLGLEIGSVDAMLAAAANDTETYFLSAESHNMWRGALPYEQFPMRRCISAQYVVPLA